MAEEETSNQQSYRNESSAQPPASGNGQAGGVSGDENKVDRTERTEDPEVEARRQAERLKDEGLGVVDEQRGRLASEISAMGRAMRSAADTLRDEGDQRGAYYAEWLAARAERTSDYTKRKSLDELKEDVRRFAKRRPEMFYGGLFLAGLVGARVVKAGSGGMSSAQSGESSEYTGTSEASASSERKSSVSAPGGSGLYH